MLCSCRVPDHIRTPRNLLVDRFFTQCLVVRKERTRERERTRARARVSERKRREKKKDKREKVREREEKGERAGN